MYCVGIAKQEGTITTTIHELPIAKSINLLVEGMAKLTLELSECSYNMQNAYPRK
jgi:hypothetical protein